MKLLSNTASNNNNEISDSAVEYLIFKPRLQIKVIAVIAKNKLSWNIHRSDQGIGTLGYFYTTTDSFCAATIIIPDQSSGQ